MSDFKVAGLTGEGVKVIQRDSGEESMLEAETIVLALGATPERSLVDDLKKEEIEFHRHRRLSTAQKHSTGYI